MGIKLPIRDRLSERVVVTFTPADVERIQEYVAASPQYRNVSDLFRKAVAATMGVTLDNAD